jgi:DNA uptake protein ComE-like DNA-binding protein
VSDSSITHLGKQWERWHSLWIGWTFTAGMFNWIAFLYVGVRARRQRWVLWGAFYSIPFILAMVFAEGSEAVMDAVVALMIVMGIVSIVHAFRIRPDYLRTIASGLQAAPKPAFYPPEQRHGGATHRQPTPPPATAPTPTPAPAASPTAVTDLSTASEEELAAIPEIGATLARRAVEERESRGGFSSVDEFGRALELKPHVVERLRPRVFVGARPAPRPESRPSGRVVDF